MKTLISLAIMIIMSIPTWAQTSDAVRAQIQSMHALTDSGHIYGYAVHVVSTNPKHTWDVNCPTAMAAQLNVGWTYSVRRIYDEKYGIQLLFYLEDHGVTCVIEKEN